MLTYICRSQSSNPYTPLSKSPRELNQHGQSSAFSNLLQYLITMHALSLFALLLPIVAVNGYTQCDCQTASDDGKWKFDPVLTHWVCYHSYGNNV